MKQGSALLAAGILLLGTVGLLNEARNAWNPDQSQTISTWLVKTQLGDMGTAILPEESGNAAELEPLESDAESGAETEAEATLDASPSARQVPVKEVAEAWDEEEREHQTLPPSPTPITVDGSISLEIRNETDYAVDFTQLPALTEGLDFSVDGPVILLMHTHGSESYQDPDTGVYRTQDPEKSVMAVAEHMKQVLEERGYQTVHDSTICDEPDFNHAYQTSRQVIQNAMAEYPTIALVLDIHRDAVEDENGEQMRMACSIDGEDAAKLMLVVGTDAGGLEHPNWRENLSLAAVLQARMQQRYSGMMRPVNLRTERFNQDLAPMDLLVEVGASGNTLEEAIRSGESFAGVLADVLDQYSGKSS